MINEVPSGIKADVLRSRRGIEPFITDYLTDDAAVPPDERVSYYRMLRNELGVHSIRWEARMKHLINPDSTFNEQVVTTYQDSLIAMKEAGLTPSSVVLFTPEKWMLAELKKNPETFFDLYRKFAERVKGIFKAAGVEPNYVQVMNEINMGWQTKLSIDQTIHLIRVTHDIFAVDFPKAKIMTTILADSKKKSQWQFITKELIEKAGDKLDALGFDYYPGSYDAPAISFRSSPLRESKPFNSFGKVEPYEWIIEQKLEGILKGKEIIISETGTPSLTTGSRFQRLGYDRIVQSLDHLLLPYERAGYKAREIISAIGFFTGGDIEAVDTKARIPGTSYSLDFTPWTLVRKNEQGEWHLTNAGSRLKHLIQTRINSA